MNQKQLTATWVGITIIVLLVLFQSGVLAFIYAPYRGVEEGIITLMMSWRILVIVAVVTIGFICTAASKKNKKPKDD